MMVGLHQSKGHLVMVTLYLIYMAQVYILEILRLIIK
jgi:hypothetical protein